MHRINNNFNYSITPLDVKDLTNLINLTNISGPTNYLHNIQTKITRSLYVDNTVSPEVVHRLIRRIECDVHSW